MQKQANILSRKTIIRGSFQCKCKCKSECECECVCLRTSSTRSNQTSDTHSKSIPTQIQHKSKQNRSTKRKQQTITDSLECQWIALFAVICAPKQLESCCPNCIDQQLQWILMATKWVCKQSQSIRTDPIRSDPIYIKASKLSVRLRLN